MTSAVISPNASGTGQFTIAVPNSNNNQTLTLPDATGTLLESSNPTVSQLNTGQLAGMRNKIINGDMNIAQRGTSGSGGGYLTVDRFLITGILGTAAITQSQQADAPSSNEFQYSYRMAVTTADTSIAAGEVSFFQQNIEGYNVRDLIGKTFTLSFWVRSSKTGIHCVSFQNSGRNRSYVVEYTISAANTWEYKTITVSGGLITAGTWDWINGVGLRVSLATSAGSTYQTTAGAWQTGEFYATANQVNCLDTIGNIFAITGVQLEVGSVATPFEHRPFGAELALCQRYYQKFQYARAVGAASSATGVAIAVSLVCSMRATPTFTGSVSQLFRYDATNASIASAVYSVGALYDNNVYLNITGLTVTDNAVYWTTFNSSAFSAEL